MSKKSVTITVDENIWELAKDKLPVSRSEFFENQLKMLDEFMLRYKEDLKNADNKELIEEYFVEYVSYFKNLLKFISRLFYVPN